MKPRSLPNSSLDHANQNGFHLPNDPLTGANNGNRTPKNPSRTSQIENPRKVQQNSPVRYNAGMFFFFRYFYFSSDLPCLCKICPSMILLCLFLFSSFINIL
jgi:hypothetical protein